MKFFFIIFLICFGYQKTNAQITLTRADVPDAGDVIYTFQSPDSIFSVGSSGANITWDFSQMNIDSTSWGLPVYWTQLISANTTHMARSGGWVFYDDYFYLDSLIYMYVGEYTIFPGPNGYTCTSSYNQKLLTFPFTYNDSFSNTFTASGGCSNGIPWNYTETDSVVCDGYGTLFLPFGTYDALRIYKKSSISNAPSYTWYTNNHKCPLLETSGQFANGNYRFHILNSSPVISSNENIGGSDYIKCFYSGLPGKYNIELKNNVKSNQVKFMCIDLQGRNIKLTPSIISETRIVIDISDFSVGIYFLNIYMNGFSHTFKLVNGQ